MCQKVSKKYCYVSNIHKKYGVIIRSWLDYYRMLLIGTHFIFIYNYTFRRNE